MKRFEKRRAFRDAARRLLKLEKEREDYYDDIGWDNITQEMQGVAAEIRVLLKEFIKGD